MKLNSSPNMQGPVCPIPLDHSDVIILGHGSGGSKTLNLIKNTFRSRFDNPILGAENDAGVISVQSEIINSESRNRIAVSTDSHVVFPLFFPGGDIGRLAICGTVNDVAMMGAQPQYLTAGFILEEGLPISILEQVVDSMKQAANEANVIIIAGDTKVVEKGKADQLYITTTGIGSIPDGVDISGSNAEPGDIVIISGSIGDHGIAVLEARGELGFQSRIISDIAPLNHLVHELLSSGAILHTLRDPTRGGLATSLNEIARQSDVGIVIEETTLPIKPQVAAACEMLGFDPLYVANEGKLIAIVPPESVDTAISVIRKNTYGKDGTIIGKVVDSPSGRVIMKTSMGSKRLVDLLTGEMLPRIC